MSTSVSVLIPTRDRAKKVRRCVKSVLTQKGVDLEVIVFDDGSVRQPFDGKKGVGEIRVLRSESPVGTARARNRLAEAAMGHVLVYLDDDAYLGHPGLLRKVVDVFSQYGEMGIAAFRIVDRIDGQTRFRTPFTRLQRFHCPAIVDQGRLVPVFLGGGYAVRAEVVEKTGGYEGFLCYMGEEQDLAFKVLEEGYTIRYVPHITVQHEPGSPIPSRSGDRSRLFYNVRNRIYLARRYIPAFCLPSYLLYWIFIYFGKAIMSGKLGGLACGLWAGGRDWTDWVREPLSGQTQRYLRRYGGRLWF